LLFQEKLKDFEATPDATVWENISAKLNSKKDDRKVIPIWWKFAGVAAALLLFLTVGNLVFDNSNNDINVVDTENTKDINKADVEENTSVANNDNSSNETEDNNFQSSNNNLNHQTEANQSKNQKPNNIANLNELVSEKNQTKLKSDSNNFHSQKTSKANKLLAGAQTNEASETSKSSEQLSNNTKDKAIESNISQENKKEVIAEIKEEKNDIIENTFSEEIKNKTEEQLVVKEEEEEETLLIEDVLANNKEKDEKESINRWQINPNVAPVYFNSLGEGSSIHEQLVSNEKSGLVNMSYGVNISYAINDKLSIKSGVNRVNLGYSTNDVIVYENTNGFLRNTDLFRNIKFSNDFPKLSFLSEGNFSFAQSPSVVPDKSMALINQEMTFYEIPLEVKYKLSDKKVAFSLVGGFSTFLLNDNTISYELNGEKTKLGEAANLNNVSYSANIGFGLDYNISKNVNLNLDPMFKYQINTFNNTSGSFKPYFIGVYSGINIKF